MEQKRQNTIDPSQLEINLSVDNQERNEIIKKYTSIKEDDKRKLIKHTEKGWCILEDFTNKFEPIEVFHKRKQKEERIKLENEQKKKDEIIKLTEKQEDERKLVKVKKSFDDYT
jgi:hypothetical protein